MVSDLVKMLFKDMQEDVKPANDIFLNFLDKTLPGTYPWKRQVLITTLTKGYGSIPALQEHYKNEIILNQSFIHMHEIITEEVMLHSGAINRAKEIVDVLEYYQTAIEDIRLVAQRNSYSIKK